MAGRGAGAKEETTTEELSVGKLLGIALQLALVLAVVHTFGIAAGRGLNELTVLIFVGFLAHALAPARLRLPIFLVVSLVGFALVLGVFHAAILVGLGLSLIGICHLPLPHLARCLLLVVAGAVLAVVRSPAITTEWETRVMPILGGIFMFRLMIYMYDLRNEPAGVTLWQRLGYFFLLPNVILPLFPIVDYRAYLRSLKNPDRLAVYHRGVELLLRGSVHTLLYRIIYQELSMPTASIQDLGSLVLFMVSSYTLYLRVSGLFHIVIGMLCLFGYDLPKTMDNYFLAGGFNDLWRRMNIYWKDFMMKLFYYPLFMRLRKKGPTMALVVSTVFVFYASWGLHTYQTWWVSGYLRVTAMDGWFWTIFAAAVLTNTLLEAKFGRRRAPIKQRRIPIGIALVRSLKTVGMFIAMCSIWSFWIGESPSDFFSLLAQAGNSGPMEFVWLVLGIAGVVAIGVVGQIAFSLGLRVHPVTYAGKTGYTLATTAGLLLLSATVLQREDTHRYLAAVMKEGLNQRDQELMIRGYYEDILVDRSLLGEIADAQSERPATWLDLDQTDAVRRTGDLLDLELRPDYEIEFKESLLHTNRWGMRDKDYSREKPAGTFRIGLLGGSIELGSGLEDGDVYSALVEELLGEGFEILNFAVPGYSLIEAVVSNERKALDFDLDVCIYATHFPGLNIVTSNLRALVENEVPLVYEELEAVVRKARLEPGMSAQQVTRALRPKNREWPMKDLLAWGYGRIVEDCRARGVVPVWLLVPLPEDQQSTPGIDVMRRIAKEAGFLTLELTHTAVYGDRDPESLVLRPWDRHPNAEASRLLADALHGILLENSEALGLDPSGAR